MTEKRLVVISAAGTGRQGHRQLGFDRQSQVDRNGAAGGNRGGPRELHGNFGPDLETTRADERAHVGSDWFEARFPHPLDQRGDDASGGTSPADVGDTDTGVGLDHQADTVSHEDGQRQIALTGEKSVPVAEMARA